MAYSDFTLEKLEAEFQLTIQEQVDSLLKAESIPPSKLLQETLVENIPLALEIDTEKARSEMIIVPILIELRKLFKRQISLFSGNDFNVDKQKGLTGRCDFIISNSPRQLNITAPVATLVEAKNDNLKSGIPQCIAEMVAAQIFNENKNNQVPCIYGVVTTGSLWKFLQLEKSTVLIEAKEHFVGNIDSILGILVEMINQANYEKVSNLDQNTTS